MKHRVALIDADIIIYELASVCETAIPWPYGDNGEVLWTRHLQLDQAWAGVLDRMETLAAKCQAHDYIACITTSSENWRFDVYPPYKSNRSKGIKPMGVGIMRDRMNQEEWCRLVPPLEGDDVLGILQTKPNAGDTIIISTDKDMQTIPGQHYNPGKDKFFTVTQGMANSYHLRQAMSGDTTDGYPGCPGIGEKKALNLVPDSVEDSEVLDLWNDALVPAFVKAGKDEAFALGQARVARILRATDYNPAKKEVLLWTPDQIANV
jgi:DNA polymerase-1